MQIKRLLVSILHTERGTLVSVSSGVPGVTIRVKGWKRGCEYCRESNIAGNSIERSLGCATSDGSRGKNKLMPYLQLTHMVTRSS